MRSQIQSNPIAGLYREIDGNFQTSIESSALLIIDMQNGSVRPDAGYGRFYAELGLHDVVQRKTHRFGALVQNIRSLLLAYRGQSRPIIYFTVSYEPNLENLPRHLQPRLEYCRINGLTIPFAVTGSFEAQVIDEIAPQPGEIVLQKSTASAFASTTAAEHLQRLGVDSLVVCGVATNYCVESTVRDAADRGFAVTVISDACDAVSEENHELGLASMAPFARVLQLAELTAGLEGVQENES